MISVIVPLYKGGKYIPSIIENVYQMMKYLKSKKPTEEVELIFVNYYPEEVIDKITKKEMKITFLFHAANSGIHQARISGLEAAKGEYVLFLDQDDYVEEDFLYSQLEAIKNSDVVVSNGFRDFGNYKKKLYKYSFTRKLISIPFFYIYGTDMIFSPGQCLIKSNSIPVDWKNHVMKTSGCDDYFLWILMLNCNCQITTNFTANYYHRETQKNYSNSRDRMLASLEEMIEILRHFSYIEERSINILHKRLEIKKAQDKSRKELIKKLLQNPAICAAALLYKLCGYY